MIELLTYPWGIYLFISGIGFPISIIFMMISSFDQNKLTEKIESIAEKGIKVLDQWEEVKEENIALRLELAMPNRKELTLVSRELEGALIR